MSKQTFDLAEALGLVKQYYLLEQRQGKARAKKIDLIFDADFRYTDCAAKTTRLDKEEFKALNFLALQAIADDATRIMATMPAEMYRAERDLLEGDALEAFRDFRAKATAMAGPYLKSLGKQLLRREPASVQAKVAKAAEAAKAERAAKKAAKSTETETDAKTGREKILAQMANIEKIMQSDDDPQYPVSKVQAALAVVISHLG